MKNKNLIVIIIMMIIATNIRAQNSTCVLNLPGNMPQMIFASSVSYSDLDVQDKNVFINGGNQGVYFHGNTKFSNCRIYLENTFRYTDKKYEFYNCEILIGEGHGFMSFGGFNPSNSVLIFEGNCITGYNTAEILHVDKSGFRFVNNYVSVSTYPHLFHMVNPKADQDNSFYGNYIKNDFNGNLGIIKLWNATVQDFTVGGSVKNIFHNKSGKIIGELGENNKNLIVENSDFYSDNVSIDLNDTPLVTVSNCNFKSESNQMIGIGIQSKKSISCTNATFSKLDMGIHSKDNNLAANNNNFSNINNAIKVSKSSTNGSGEIKSNTFTSNNIDVFSTGSFIELEVSGNNFSGREFGFLADGHNNYELKNNSFYNSYAGSIAYANGANNNFVEGNRYYTLIGTHALEDNSSYQFTDNCFSTAGGDVYLDGTVASAVGSAGAEANNCFTKGGIPDISAATDTFEYYRSDNSPICEDPFTPGSYTEINADIKEVLNCGSGTPFSSTVRKYCSISFKYSTCKQAKLMLIQIDKDIADVTKSISYRAKVKDNILISLKNCRLKILVFLKTCIDPKPEDPRFPDGEISSASWTGNEPNVASSVLRTSSDKYERAAYVNTMISLGNFAEINAYLQSYSSEDEEEADFIAVQKINVARFLSQDEYMPSQGDVYTLQLASNKPYTLAAYARGLYTQLTGNIIMPPIPRITFNRSIAQKSSSFGIMPNPVTDQLQVSLPTNQSCELRITDINGKTYYQKNVFESMVDINTSTWPSGIYFVVCNNEQGIGECKKLIKQ